MIYREVVCAKDINTLCGQNVEIFNAKPNGTYSDH